MWHTDATGAAGTGTAAAPAIALRLNGVWLLLLFGV